MRHLKWTRHGRKLSLPTGQRAFKGYCGQLNVALPNGDFAPFVWDEDARLLRYADVEARFTRDAIEFWRDGVRQAITRPRLQRRSYRGWVDEEARVRIERLADEDGLRAIACARIALVLESPRATARHILVAGGRSRARGDTSLVARLPGEYRVVLEHDLGGAPTRRDRSLGAVGHISARGWRVAWTRAEDRERAVRVTERGLSIELAALVRAKGQRRPAEQWTSPDTYGPVLIAAANDDGNSRISDPGAGESMYWPNGVPSGYGAVGSLSINDTSGYSDRTVHARFASIDLDGTPTSIDSGTQLYYDRQDIDPGYGSGGSDIVRFRCEATNTPATGSDTSDTSTGRPVLRTYNAAYNDHTFAHDDFADQTVNLTTAIGGLRTAGYSYTGDSTHAIMILAGAAEAWGITTVSYRGIGYDLAHSTRDPAELTIVYTPAGSGGTGDPIAGESAGVATATGALKALASAAGASAGVAAVAGALKASASAAGTSAGVATATATARALGALAGTGAGVGAVAGALKARGALAGSSAGAGTASAQASASASLAGSSAGAGTATATAQALASLAGSSAGSATPAAQAKALAALSGSASGLATVTGALSAQSDGAVTGAAQGAATATATLRALGALAGSSAGAGTATAAAKAQASLAGTSAGVATSSARPRATAKASGVSAGLAAAAAVLLALGALTGSAAGSATVTGALSSAASGAVTGSASGASTATATLKALARVAGTAAGTATVVGDLSDAGPSAVAISGTAAGFATVTGRLLSRTGALPPTKPGRVVVHTASSQVRVHFALGQIRIHTQGSQVRIT